MLEKFKKSSNLKNVVQLASGSLIAQVITVLMSPLSTRLFSSAEFGVYTLLMSFITIFGPIIAGRYDVLIVSAETEKESNELVVGSIFVSIVNTILISLIYLIYLNYNKSIVSLLGNFSYVIIFILILNAINNILTNYNNRYSKYNMISWSLIGKSSTQNFSMIAMGYMGIKNIGLLLSQLIGFIVGNIVESKYFLRDLPNIFKVKKAEVKSTLIKHKDQPLYSMPATFVNAFSYSILNFMIELLFGLNVLGYYSISFRLLGLPLSIISTNVSKVFYKKAVDEKKTKGNYYKSFMTFLLPLTVLAILMVAFLMLLAPTLFEFFFGEGWNVSGEYVQILAPMFGIRFVVSALNSALLVSRRQKLELLMQISFIISAVVLFAITRFTNSNIEIFLILVSIFYSIVYLYFLYKIYNFSKEMD